MSILKGVSAGIAAGRIAARRVLNRVLPWAVLGSVLAWAVLSRYGWNYYESALALSVAVGVFGGFYALKVRRDIRAEERAKAEKEAATAGGSAR